jgi:hypothetical protein
MMRPAHARAGPKDARDVPTCFKMIRQMPWHGTAVLGNQDVSMLFEPYKNCRVRRPRRRCLRVVNRHDFHLTV